MATLPDDAQAQLEHLYDEMRPRSLYPLWEVIAALVTPSPSAATQSAKWRFGAREMGCDREPPFFFSKWAETVRPDGAARFGVDMRWSRIAEVERACQELDAFRLAAPDQQPDRES